MTKGKLVLIPFPFDDFSKTKIRPALCITDKLGPFEQVIVAFITTNLNREEMETDLVIDHNFQSYGLRLPSKVQLHRLITISSSVVERELGSLPNELLEEVNRKLGKIFK